MDNDTGRDTERMQDGRHHIAVVGSGISGLAAAWLLAQRHRVTLFEASPRLGGHTNTVDVGAVPVDTGFIVYNEATYPNLTALFAHLGIATRAAEMSFGVSLDQGRLEYSGSGLDGLFAQRRNLVSPRFWSMLRDTARFYRNAPRDLPGLGDITLDAYLDRLVCGAAFRDDHLYPMAAAIWSTPAGEIGAHPAADFIRFCDNHGLLQITDRPVWRTVLGGARTYVERIAADLPEIRTARPVHAIHRYPDGVRIASAAGNERFDHVVIAAHADQALAMLADADDGERTLLGTFGYRRNEAVLHGDRMLMPFRRRVWSSWNYLAEPRANPGSDATNLSVSYWMNRLQGLPGNDPLIVTLNPAIPPDPARVHARETYHHPVFDTATGAAQKRLWSLQGRRRTWFCGAYFGAGFHEDGLQAGLAVAEQLGGLRRPWQVAAESGRIALGSSAPIPLVLQAA